MSTRFLGDIAKNKEEEEGKKISPYSTRPHFMYEGNYILDRASRGKWKIESYLPVHCSRKIFSEASRQEF